MVAGIEKQLGAINVARELAGGVEVSLQRPRVVFHDVNLGGLTRRPRPELGYRQASAIEQRSTGAGPGLRQLLRRHHSQGEAGVHEVARQFIGRAHTSLEDCVEADLLGVRDPFREVGEGFAVVQVGRVDNVAGGAQLRGEFANADREPVGVVEKEYFSHVDDA